jgi:uncharacterized protein (TIGR02466 family)
VKSPPTTPQDNALLQQAAGLIRSGRAADGATLCRQLLQHNPRQPDALQLLAMAARDSGALPEAETLFRESLASAPGRPDIMVNLANLLRSQNGGVEAKRLLRKATRQAPEYVPGWHSMGLLLHTAGDEVEALRCARRVTTLAPGFPAGWELVAAIEQKRNRPAAAIAACREGLKHEPKAPRLHYSLAQLLRQECEFEDAAACYGEARALGMEAPDLYRNQAEALLEAGEIEQAMDCATSGVERFPEHALLQRTRARLHWETKTPGDPVATLARSAREHPQNADLWCTLVTLLERLGRDGEGSAALAEARERGCPRSPEFQTLEALDLARQGEPGQAKALFEEVAGQHPRNNEIALTFAGHLLTHGEPERAEALCAAVLENSPHDQLAWTYRGTAWQLLGDPRESWLLDYQQMVRPVAVPVPDGYGSTAAFFSDVEEALEALHRTQAHPLEQSVRGGTQTNGFLFRLKHPLLQVLEAQIRQAVCSVLADFPNDHSHPFWGRRETRPSGDGIRFSGAWSVRLRSEGYHTHHIHTEGWISSALYVALPDELGQGEGNEGHIEFGVPMAELGLDLPARRTVRPEVGTLVLFPSYMWHGTVPFTSDQPRITVAFDLQPQA